MALARVYTMSGEEVDTVQRPDCVCSTGVSTHVLWEVVRVEQTNRRRGTASTKTRAFVVGSGKKPWLQKHTGHARSGSKKSPIWRGGGVAFGPHPRPWSIKLNRKIRRKALAGILSERLDEGNLRLIRDFFLEGKTRQVAGMLEGNGCAGRKTLILTLEGDELATRASRNIPGVFSASARSVPVTTLVNSEVVLMDERAIDELKARLL